jgi:hypothetical protein
MQKKPVVMRKGTEVLLHKKVVDLFLNLDKDYISHALKVSGGLTFSHGHMLAQMFEDCKLMKTVSSKSDRCRVMEFTAKGRVFAEHLRKILTILNGD